MEDCEFQKTTLQDLVSFRQMQTLDLKGQVNDPLEERIELAKPDCLKMRFAGKDAGYALLDVTAEVGISLLEFYLVPSRRRHARIILDEFVRSFRCGYWIVNSHDSFALPLLLECGFTYEIDCCLFSIDRPKREDVTDPDGIMLDAAAPEDLDCTFKLVMQDGFYTGNGRKALAARITNGEIYLLRSEGELLGAGFICPLARTPQYADIAMIIDGRYRGRGYAYRLVSRLVRISFDKGLIPTALTSPGNIASRKTLEKCGFYMDGCLLLAKTT